MISKVFLKILWFILFPLLAYASDSVVFTRAGARVTKDFIEEAKVYSNSRLLKSREFAGAPNSVGIDFDWLPGKRYEFEVKTTKGVLRFSSFSPVKPSPYKLHSMKVGRIKPEAMPEINDGHLRVYDAIAISPDAEYLACALFDRTVRCFKISSAKEIFRHRITDGVGRSVAFSEDGKNLLVGEMSLDGNLLLLEVPSGKIKWRYRTADDIGTMSPNSPTDIRWREFYKPGVREIHLRGKTVYMKAERTFKEEGVSRHTGMVYAFDIGRRKLLWKFPQKKSIGRVYIDERGKYVLFTTFEDNPSLKEKAAVFVLNGENGDIIWKYEIPPLRPYFEHSTAYGGSISQDGRWVTICTGDGRVYLFDNFESERLKMAEITWMKEISTPILAGGIPIRASCSYAHFMEDELILVTRNTYTTSRSLGLSPPIEHPNSHSLFCFDTDGNLKWRWTAGGSPSKLALSEDKRYLAVSIAHDIITMDEDVYGVYCFDLKQKGGISSKLSWFYHTEGICVTCAISNDGKYIASVEVPIDMDPSKGVRLIGKHIIHILE